MIRGVNLLSGHFDVKSGLPIQYRIEPTNGMTNPKLHPNSSVLIQDDKDFNAVITGLGALGVVYSVTIATVPFYWIQELREIVDWTAAKKLLQQGALGDILKYHNAEVWVNPYTSKALLTRREQLTSAPAGELAEQKPQIFAALTNDLPALQTVKANIVAADNTNGIPLSEEPLHILGIILAVILRWLPMLVPYVSDVSRFIVPTLFNIHQ
jgi:hypothetical protein